MSAGSWRRRLALRIDPTLAAPLDVARSTAVTLLNERRFQRLAETHANTLRTAAGMLERLAPDTYVACQIPASIRDGHLVAVGEPAETIPAHEWLRREADRQTGVFIQ